MPADADATDVQNQGIRSQEGLLLEPVLFASHFD